MIPTVVAAASLVGLLAFARLRNSRRDREVAAQWSERLSHSGHEVLEYMVLAVNEHRIGLEVLRRAAQSRDAARLQRALDVVEGFAPGLEEGIRTVRNMSKAVPALVAMPPIWPTMWRARRLRCLTGAALVAHVVLVAATERVRVRIWLLAQGLRLCVASLQKSSRHEHSVQWAQVEEALRDLTVVGDEAEATYRCVVKALDEAGGFLPA